MLEDRRGVLSLNICCALWAFAPVGPSPNLLATNASGLGLHISSQNLWEEKKERKKNLWPHQYAYCE